MLDRSDFPIFIKVDPINPFINIDRVESGANLSMLIIGTLINDGSNSSELININILPINKPPYFDNDLENVTMIAGDQFFYKLPNIIDPEGDKVQIVLNSGTASAFLMLNSGKIIISPTIK